MSRATTASMGQAAQVARSADERFSRMNLSWFIPEVALNGCPPPSDALEAKAYIHALFLLEALMSTLGTKDKGMVQEQFGDLSIKVTIDGKQHEVDVPLLPVDQIREAYSQIAAADSWADLKQYTVNYGDDVLTLGKAWKDLFFKKSTTKTNRGGFVRSLRSAFALK